MQATESSGLRAVTPPDEHQLEGMDVGAESERTSGSVAAGFQEPPPSWATPVDEDDLRMRAEAASAELRRRAEEMRAEPGRPERRPYDELPPWGDAERNLPGARSLAMEIAVGAARLGATLVTAPIRLVWALLRPRSG